MKYCFFMFLFTASFLLKGQSVITYKFVVEDKVIADSTTGFYRGSAFEYQYKRVYKKDGIFEEKGLFSNDSDDTTAFRVKNGCWYIKIGSKWQIFFSPEKVVNPKVKIAGKWNILYLVDTSKIGQFQSFIYKAEPIGSQAGGVIKYWFNPKKGIIKIETSEVTLVREDVKIKAH